MGSHSTRLGHVRLLGSPTGLAASPGQGLDVTHPWSPYQAQGGHRAGAHSGPGGRGEGRMD